MAGKIKVNPRYEVVSFRTTAEQKQIINEARGQSSISEFIDLLVTLYLQDTRDGHGTSGMEHKVCAA
jgi:hypothetical protein